MIITRQEAAKQSMTTYFTGKPCLRGHYSRRKVANGVCTECAKNLTRRWRATGKQCEMNKAKELPSVEYLSERFYIENNVLFWNTGYRRNKPAGHINKVHKYIEVRLDNTLHKAHRIIYKMLTGIEPIFMVDHIDGDVTNNAITNLRECGSQENARNSAKRIREGDSKYKGVFVLKGKWVASVTVDDLTQVYPAASELDAALLYDKIAKETFGEFAKLNTTTFPELCTYWENTQ